MYLQGFSIDLSHENPVNRRQEDEPHKCHYRPYAYDITCV